MSKLFLRIETDKGQQLQEYNTISALDALYIISIKHNDIDGFYYFSTKRKISSSMCDNCKLPFDCNNCSFKTYYYSKRRK